MANFTRTGFFLIAKEHSLAPSKRKVAPIAEPTLCGAAGPAGYGLYLGLTKDESAVSHALLARPLLLGPRRESRPA